MRLRSPGGQKPSRRWTVGASPQCSLLLSAGLSLGVPAGGGDPLQGVNVDPSVGSLGPSRALEEREGGSWCLSVQLSFSWAPGWAAALSGKALGDPFIFQQSHRPRALPTSRTPASRTAAGSGHTWPHGPQACPVHQGKALGPGAPLGGGPPAHSARRRRPSGGSCAGSKFITFYNTISRADRCIRDRPQDYKLQGCAHVLSPGPGGGS